MCDKCEVRAHLQPSSILPPPAGAAAPIRHALYAAGRGKYGAGGFSGERERPLLEPQTSAGTSWAQGEKGGREAAAGEERIKRTPLPLDSHTAKASQFCPQFLSLPPLIFHTASPASSQWPSYVCGKAQPSHWHSGSMLLSTQPEHAGWLLFSSQFWQNSLRPVMEFTSRGCSNGQLHRNLKKRFIFWRRDRSWGPPPPGHLTTVRGPLSILSLLWLQS